MTFSDEEKNILERYFTNTDKPIFAIKNLPEVIKGTLFSRYSRTVKSVRRLFLDEFVNADVLKGYFERAAPHTEEGINTARADDFYERILVGYGDDSVAELGGAHVALEEISMLASKSVEEHRIGLSPLEKSTRYVYFHQKVDGQHQYYRDPRIMASPHAKMYVETLDHLFDAYATIVNDSQPFLKTVYPGDENELAYKSSIRGKACDLARGLLPLACKTNVGIYGNGRAFEYLLVTLLNDPLTEVRDMGMLLNENLKQIISAFMKRATNERGEKYRRFLNETEKGVCDALSLSQTPGEKFDSLRVELVEYDPEPVERVIASCIYVRSECSYSESMESVRALSLENKKEILKAATGKRANRHHKPGREFEYPYFTFEVIADWGVYKDLMRHRILTRHHQLFTNELGYWIPDELIGTDFEPVYRSAMDHAAKSYSMIKKDFPHEVQYLATHGSYNRFMMRMNLREVMHMTELRSSPQGHPTYRKVAQEMVNRVTEKLPLLTEFITPFVDFSDYELERLDAFRKIAKKAEAMGVRGFEE